MFNLKKYEMGICITQYNVKYFTANETQNQQRVRSKL